MDIGSLTGQVSIEDQVSDKLTEMVAHAHHFVDEFEGAMGTVAIGVGVAFAAITGMAISITELGEKGSKILGVENAFDRVALAAGTTGDVLRHALNEGVKDTISEFELMQSTSRLMSSGFKMTGDSALLMGQAARELGKATGTDAKGGLDLLSSALTTGRVRGLQQQIGLIDLKKGEEEFAKSLGVTVGQLNEAGKLEGKRIAILDATKAYVDRLGVSELSFAERMHQAHEAITEWTNELAKSVASSPHVMSALDELGKAFSETFAGAGKTAMETIIDWVNRFADAVGHYGPMIIRTIGEIWQGIQDTWHEVQHAWDLVPDWFKNIAKDAILAGVAVGSVSFATKGMTGTDILSAMSNLAQIWSVVGVNIGKASAAIKEWSVMVAVFKWEAVTLGVQTMSAAFLAFAATPLGIAALFTALGAALYEVYGAVKDLYKAWQDGKSMWDFFTAKDSDTWVRRWLGLSTGVATTTTSLDGQRKGLEDLMKSHEAFVGPLNQVTAAQAKGKYTNDNLTEAQKKYNEAVRDYSSSSVGGGYLALLNKVGNEMYEGVVYDHARKRSTEELALVYKTTKSTIEEIIHAEENAKKELDETMKGIREFRKVGEEGAAVVAKSFQGMAFVLHDLAVQTEGFGTIASKSVVGFLQAIPDLSDRASTHMQELRGDWQHQMGDLHELARSFEQLAQISGDSFGGIVKEIAVVVSSLDMLDRAGKALDEGGSYVSYGIAAVGAIDAATKSTSRWGATLGGAATGMKIGAQFGGVYGAVIGAAAGALIGLVRSAGAAERAINPIREQFVQLHGGLDALDKAAHDAGISLTAMLNAKNAEQYNQAITAITEALAVQDQSAKVLDDTIQKYGFSIEELGPKWAAQKLNEQAGSLLQDYDVLTAAGVDHVAIINRMGPALQEYVSQAEKTGTAIPENLRPVLQSMIDLGTLTDASGVKLTDLAGLTFTETLDKKFSTLLDTINKLVDAISRGLGTAISNIPPVHVPVVFDPQPGQERAYAGGGVVYASMGALIPFTPRGSDTVPAMLAPGEGVVTTAGMSRLGASGLNAINNGGSQPSNQEVVEAVNGLRSDLSQKLPRALAQVMKTSLVGLRTAS